jgi:hypothetical protein
MYINGKQFHKNALLYAALLITATALSLGCSNQDAGAVAPMLTVTNSPTPTNTPTNTPSPTPSPTLTPTPTNTPTPSPSPTLTPTPTPTLRPNKLYSVVSKGKTYTLKIEYQDYLYEMCVKYDITDYYELLMAQMWHESRFKPTAYSNTKDYGLMQINKCNHAWLSEKFGKTDFFDPYFSMECGVYMMSKYLKKYDDVQKALVCYNSGESKVKKGTYSTKYSLGVLADMEKLVEMEQ